MKLHDPTGQKIFKKIHNNDSVIELSCHTPIPKGSSLWTTFIIAQNIDLPEKLHRNNKAKKVRERKKFLGRSIKERTKIVEFRTEFGHWEIDAAISKKDEGELCVLTLTERMMRMCILVKAQHLLP